ncbi:MAG TPA: O-antigen ligase family protein [Elusimicrobiales bacterium]|nr:O-antigen ligase family protein [Elusimicrobiales bacterium]
MQNYFSPPASPAVRHERLRPGNPGLLIYALASVLLLAPALQAVFDLPLQLAFQRAVLLFSGAWFWLRPPSAARLAAFIKKFRSLWAAAALSLLALLASPFRGYVFNEWGNYGAGVLIFVVASFLNKEERARIDGAVAAGAWLVFGLIFLQFFVLKNFGLRPPLTNMNALALYALMVFPLALARRAWPLAAAMAALVLLSQSLGAALAGFGAAGIYAVSKLNSGEGENNKWFLAALFMVGAAAFYLLQADSLAGRLVWWRSAWDMFAARPVTGFGHAAFTWAQAGFQAPGAFREHSVYAHNYYLEFLAENGLPAAAAWFWFLLRAARGGKGLAKYAVIGALLHSCVDFGLSVPANFWLFCYLLAASCHEGAPPEAEPVPAAGPRPKAALVLALLLTGALLALDRQSLAFERARGRALAESLDLGPAAAEARLAPYLAGGLFRGPALEFLGRLTFAGRANRDNGFSSAVYYEMALLENPYSSQAWRALERIYGVPGREGAAAGLAARRAVVYK